MDLTVGERMKEVNRDKSENHNPTISNGSLAVTVRSAWGSKVFKQ